MQFIQRLARGFLWLIGLLFVFLVLTYTALLAINWKDDPASTAVRHLAETHANRAVVADRNNAYLYLLGITASEGQSPIALGGKRIEWMAWAAQQPQTAELIEPQHPRWPDRSKELPLFVEPLIDACKSNNGQCLQRLSNNEQRVDEWLELEQLHLQRYLELIQLTSMYEPLPYNLHFSFPEYQHALGGQRLLLVNAWQLARRGDIQQARNLLQNDLLFWRMALANSDLLISRMIASAAINQHFLWSIQLFQNQDGYAGLLPIDAWRAPMTESERSWDRTLSGEMIFVDGYLQQMKARELNWLANQDEDALIQRVVKVLTPPLLLKQASLNRYAEFLLEQRDLLAVPYAEMEEARERSMQLERSRTLAGFKPKYLRNLGGVLLEMQASDQGFTNYYLRIADLEGLRRASLLLAEMRNQQVTPDQIPEYLQHNELQDPYREQPFGWDEKSGSLLFEGLSENGTYRLTY
ncbi:hypothetical protein [Pseudomonas sp. Gutcm_11s]|uniref:hypothetical protein n=1 Tax=Pseudomonas sp. Gutcm_11s TaxID=3026088 RepID=UPI00235E357E|nr:hypothetical protein [Pseudomonas sp. Gutcm_11s]MDD0841784.1 hypothetical protein [Pseudomonas sp. Gutcm_11s]